jgi:DNA-binding NarL/FixJ family response regulator
MIPHVRRTKPDVVILDIRLPGLDGLAVLEMIQQQYPDVNEVILSVSADRHAASALQTGASGHVVKSIDPVGLPSTVRRVVAGAVYNALGARGDGSGSGDAAGLTIRERAILRAVARGLANRAIAKELWVSEQTVKFHLTNVYRKLGVENRTEAARAAYRIGLAESPFLDIKDAS